VLVDPGLKLGKKRPVQLTLGGLPLRAELLHRETFWKRKGGGPRTFHTIASKKEVNPQLGETFCSSKGVKATRVRPSAKKKHPREKGGRKHRGASQKEKK